MAACSVACVCGYQADSSAVVKLHGRSAVLGRRVDGILGHDVFLHVVIDVDYATESLTLYGPATLRYDGSGERVPLFIRANEPFLVASLRQHGRPEITALLKIDTGSADFIGVNGSFVDATRLISAAEPRIPTLGAVLGGQTENFVTRLDTFALGSIRIARPVVGYSADLSRVGDAGTIAGAFHSRYRTIVDYSRQQMVLEPMTHAAHDEEYFDMSGAFVIGDGPQLNEVTVVSVTPRSPAEDAGLQAGDVITALNGRPVAQIRLRGVRQQRGESKSESAFEDADGGPPNENAHQLQAIMPAPAPASVPQRARGTCRPSGTPRQTGLSAACGLGARPTEGTHLTVRL